MKTMKAFLVFVTLMVSPSGLPAEEAKSPSALPALNLVELKVYFYPGVGAVKCAINFSAMTGAQRVDKAMLVVKEPDGREIARGEPEQLEDGDGECIIKLPGRLVAGRYTVALTLSAGGKPFGAPVEQSFEKKNFPFEGNRIGVTDKVLFPWTPMKVEAASVSCWNRTFVLNDDGFFRQVKSGDWELLNRPVFLAARSEAKEMKWQGGGVQFTKQGPSSVDFTAQSQCEKLQAEVSVHSEFDGMFQYTLTLRPKGDGHVDRVDLVVPLKEEHAWLLHACSDGCRTNASLFTPARPGARMGVDESQPMASDGHFHSVPVVGRRPRGAVLVGRFGERLAAPGQPKGAGDRSAPHHG